MCSIIMTTFSLFDQLTKFKSIGQLLCKKSAKQKVLFTKQTIILLEMNKLRKIIENLTITVNFKV